MRLVFFHSAFLAVNIGSGNRCISAFAPIITPLQFSSSQLRLHVEANNALLSDLKEMQSKESSTSVSDFVADTYNDEATLAEMTAIADELSGSSKLMAASTTKTPLKKATPPPFDPTDPDAWIAVTKSFIATDFGIPTSQDTSLPTTSDNEKSITLQSYSNSLLSENFIWVSGNNINDGRTGILNKQEYLTAGRYFDLRSSFPDLEYRAHDFRVHFDEEMEYYANGSSSSSVGKVTVRFTTLVTGTFDGAPLRLRSKVVQTNDKVMHCPPTSVSVTFATGGSDKGKVIKLVTDMVMDRQIGNTQGYSGIAGAAVVAGEELNEFIYQPPIVVLGRMFADKMQYYDVDYGKDHLPPFSDTIMIQLAQDVVRANLGLDKPDLLAEKFSYLEPSMGPLNKMKYLDKFSEYGILDAVKDMNYGITNYRVDPYNPYRIWVDTRALGTRTGSIGKSIPKLHAANYEAAPEAMSFSFDDDGYCTRITSAAVLDPLLGNTGGLGGVNGLLYATSTPKSALLTRSLNSFLTRAAKSMLSKVNLASGADSFRTSDGKVVNGLPSDASASKFGLPSTSSMSMEPYFAAPIVEKPMQQHTSLEPYFAAPIVEKPALQHNPAPSASTQVVNTDTSKSLAKEVGTNPPKANEITDAQVIASSTHLEDTSILTAEELREKAREARAEAAEAMERAIVLKAQAEEERKKILETKLEEEKRRLQLIEDAKKTLLESKERERQQQEVGKPKAKMEEDNDDLFSFLSPALSSKAGLKGKETKPKTTPSKRSPTLTLFTNSSGVGNSTPVKPSTKHKSQSPKRSPTLNIFSSAPKVSPSKRVKKKPSPTTPDLALMGVGGTPKIKAVKPASKKSPKKIKSSLPKPSAATRSATFSILGIGEPLDSKSDSEKSSAAKAPATKSPTLNLFGVGGSPQQPSSTKEKSKRSISATKKIPTRSSKQIKSSVSKSPPASRSATFSILGIGAPSDTKSDSEKSSAAKAPATKSPTLNLFGVGGSSKHTSKSATKSISTAPKKLSKSQMSSKKADVSKATFGGFFSSDSASTKKDEGSSIEKRRKKKITTKVPPKGVPVLKGWKANAKNEIQGKVYSSASFREGEMITTSPVKGRLQSGTVVISESGTKYYLE